MTTHTSLLIVGAGPGGYETALRAAKAGIDTTLIEAQKPGGTCLNCGCIPTKALCRSAELIEELKMAEELGLETSTVHINYSAIQARKSRIVSELRAGIEQLLTHPHIHYVTGTAAWVDQHTIRVGDTLYTAPHILLATGSQAATLPIPGAALPGVVTSDELLEMPEPPRRMCIVGGGVIGLEFASIFCSLGTEVTVLEFASEVLPRMDSDVAKRLRQALSRRGIAIQVQAAVEQITGGGEEVLKVHYARKGKSLEIETDCVLMAVGRKPRTDMQGLSNVGIDFTPRGITVNSFCQTSLPHVYAIGDATGGYMLAHAATAQGRIALQHMLSEGNFSQDTLTNEAKAHKPMPENMQIMPAAVFTLPEMAAVGCTEDELRQNQQNYTVHKVQYRQNGKALCMGEPVGICKLLSDKASGRLLGAHILGAHAADMVQEIAVLMQNQGTREQLAATIHIHPSLSELLFTAAEN